MVYPLIIDISLTSLYDFIYSTIDPSFKKELSNFGCKYSSSNYEVILYPTKCGKSEYFLYIEYEGYDNIRLQPVRNI